MMIFDFVFGILLLFAGRNLFWVCVGIVGFLIGLQCALALGFTNGWVALFAAMVLGVLGAVLAISFEWFAVVFGVGFLGGGYLLMNILHFTTPPMTIQESYSWLIFVVGGIVGTCLMVIIFDWTLILISSLLGATLIISAYHWTQGARELLFIGCMVVGIFVQYLTLGPTASTADK